jgi:hypothetical protein
MKEQHGLDGRVKIELRDQSGQLVQQRMVQNLITTAGRKLLGKLFSGTADKPEFAIAVGGASTPPEMSDTALGSQLDLAKATLGEPRIDDNNPRQVVVNVSATLPIAEGRPDQRLTEAGILITLPGQAPVLYNHVVFPLITRTGKLEMTLSWEVIF